MTAEPPVVTLSYATSTVPRGCVSSGSLGTSHEVHVLSVEWSKVSERGPGTVTPALSPWHCPTLMGRVFWVLKPFPHSLPRGDNHVVGAAFRRGQGRGCIPSWLVLVGTGGHICPSTRVCIVALQRSLVRSRWPCPSKRSTQFWPSPEPPGATLHPRCHPALPVLLFRERRELGREPLGRVGFARGPLPRLAVTWPWHRGM